MKKIYSKEQLEVLGDYPIEVINSTSEKVDTLNENYGEIRDIDKNLGVYILVVESIDDIKELKNGMLKDILREYTDEIICSEEVFIKSTKYCNILNQARVDDEEYTYRIERIFVKSKRREEIRFAVYKDTVRGDDIYFPRSLDVTELELMELIKKSIKEKVFSDEFIEMLKQELK